MLYYSSYHLVLAKSLVGMPQFLDVVMYLFFCQQSLVGEAHGSYRTKSEARCLGFAVPRIQE